MWHHHNNVVHGDGKASIAASIPYLCSYMESFRACSLPVPDAKGKTPILPNQHFSSAGSPISRWAAPEEGSLKANVDAGWDAASKRAGLSVIIRDHRGTVVETEWKFIPWCASAEEAEVLACLEGLRLLSNKQCTYGILESGCLRDVQVLQGDVYDRSPS